MSPFTVREFLPGVWHIQDGMGVCMTLLCGQRRALLVDTGYGTEDVGAFIATLTNLPLTVMLTHGHHDHALGARWFPETLMFPEDEEDFLTYTAEETRRKVAASAASKGLLLPEDFLTAPIPIPKALTEGDMDLGGLTARILRVPGHTPGSAVVYVPQRDLLLTGDDWNPCTWLFFPAALPVQAYRENLRRMLALPFRKVLCSHRHELYDRSLIDQFSAALTDEALCAAKPVNVGYPQDTREAALPQDQVLVFDWDKFIKEGAFTMKHIITLKAGDTAAFTNNASFCVGTGRMGLALQEEYQQQLALAQKLAGFRYIRGHGLFCDDMGIYRPYVDTDGATHENYNFTYLDRVFDRYLSQGIKPFLELGFMPEKMASGTQTIFYWKGNTTPPADHDKWTAMVKATLAHLARRYGEDEVSTWPCEVWNEPNLAGFWKDADKAAYLKLYAVTAPAVKEVLPRMAVGGPAICGGEGSQEWVRDFLIFCREHQLPVDFVSRHAYMGMTPERHGRYLYHEMRTVESILEEMRVTRDIIDSFPEYAGLPMHITEFNTSYNPLCPIHDTNLNAAYIAGLLSCLGDVAASYSYWTFGDVFEESDVPARPFHGGFGMIANRLIPKPTMWTFAFFNNLKGTPVHRDSRSVILRREDGSYEGCSPAILTV